jgi:Cu/Ag efflux protein CusF
MKTRFWMSAACVAGSLCLSTVALCQTPAKPAAPAKGEAVITAVTVTATVTQIDHKTREVTLRAEDGQEYSFVAGDAVANLAQVQKGDVVTAAYTEAVAYEVKKGGKADAAAAVAGGAAPLGTKPAAVVGGKVTATVAITAIDTKVPSVTFKGPGGNSRTVKVKDPAKLKGVSVGDTVEITYAEALAMKVEKAAKK